MSSINENLDNLFGKMESFISSKTVVGEPISVGKTTIVPLVDVSFGVGAGSSERTGDKNSSGGGAGFGAKIKPTAVMVIGEHGVQLVNVDNQSGLGKLIDLVPGIVDKVEGFVSGRKDAAQTLDEDFYEE